MPDIRQVKNASELLHAMAELLYAMAELLYAMAELLCAMAEVRFLFRDKWGNFEIFLFAYLGIMF